MPIIVDKEEKVQLICEKVFEEFVKHGIETISLNQVISNINISKGQFYHYFKTKEELVFEVISQKTFQGLKVCEEKLQESQNLLESLEVLFSFYINTDNFWQDLRKLYFDAIYMFINTDNKKIKHYNQEYYLWIDKTLIEVFQKFQIDISANHVLRFISSVADGMYVRSLMDKNFNLQINLHNYLKEISKIKE